MASVATLRAVANRLTSTPIDQLPYQVGHLATSLVNCKDVLQSSISTTDSSVVIHKLKARTSALLQDRTPEGRLSGIIIAKTLVEAGGIVLLSESGSWVRNLISCLNKPDTPEVKRLCVSTVSRIYILTADHQALVREITTPTLPAFITATFNAVKPIVSIQEEKSVRQLSPCLSAVLRSWYTLIKRFPSTFRPHTSSIKSICLSLVSDAGCEAHVQSLARDVLARLHFCAPKAAMAAEWLQMYSQTIDAAHETADLVFRAIVEDWTSQVPRSSKVTRKQKSANVPATSATDVCGLDSWSGVIEGCQRLEAHVRLLQALLTNVHSQEVHLPLGGLFDLAARLTAVTPPTIRFSLKTNNDIARDEREELWLSLPKVHISVLSLFERLTLSLGKTLVPIGGALGSQLWEVFESQCSLPVVRAATYKTVATLLENRLLSVDKSQSSHFRKLVSFCCEDLATQSGVEILRARSIANGEASKQSSSKTTLTLEARHDKKIDSRSSPSDIRLYDSAFGLLPILIECLPFHQMSGGSGLRAQIDTTSILVDHREAILASVLHPTRITGTRSLPTPSLLSFVARSADTAGYNSQKSLERLSFEALLRPRMPLVGSSIDETMHDRATHHEASQDEAEDDLDMGGSNSEQHEKMYVEHAMAGASKESTQTGSDRSELQHFFNGKKRDFTTLLEESTDAQLAASASEEHTIRQDSDDAIVSKRQRVTMTTSEDPDQIKDDSANAGQDLLAHAAEKNCPANSLPIATASNSVHAHHILTPLSDGGGKETITVDSDDSSDSGVPPIDATLVGFSDSDEDDEE